MNCFVCSILSALWSTHQLSIVTAYDIFSRTYSFLGHRSTRNASDCQGLEPTCDVSHSNKLQLVMWLRKDLNSATFHVFISCKCDIAIIKRGCRSLFRIFREVQLFLKMLELYFMISCSYRFGLFHFSEASNQCCRESYSFYITALISTQSLLNTVCCDVFIGAFCAHSLLVLKHLNLNDLFSLGYSTKQ